MIKVAPAPVIERPRIMAKLRKAVAAMSVTKPVTNSVTNTKAGRPRVTNPSTATLRQRQRRERLKNG